jgi:hypothetical protein
VAGPRGRGDRLSDGGGAPAPRSRPPPVVTVSDPRGGRSATYAPVGRCYLPAPPGGPTDRPVLPAGGSRSGGLRLLVATLAALVAAPVALAGLERRAADAAERRHAGTVALSVLPSPASTSETRVDPVTGSAGTTVTLHVRNDGPRAVTLTGAGMGPWQLIAPAAVPSGRDVPLRLVRRLRCPADPTRMPLESEPSALALDVRTDAGPRAAVLALDGVPRERLPSAARRACGVLPVADSVRLVSNGAVPQDRALRVALEVRNRSLLPRSLVDLAVAPGLAAEARDRSGRPLPASAAVPGRAVGGPSPALEVALVVRVQDCTAVPRRAGRLDAVRAVVAGADGGRPAVVSTSLQDGGQLRRLVGEVCRGTASAAEAVDRAGPRRAAPPGG